MSGKAPWWRAFEKVERAVGKPLEEAVASSRYVNTMVQGMKVQRALGGAVGRVAGGTIEKVLHAVGVSTRGDVRKVSREIAVLTREVRALKTAQQPDEAPPAKRATPARRPRNPAKGSEDGT